MRHPLIVRAPSRMVLAMLALLMCTPAWAETPSIMSIFRKKQPVTDEGLELRAEHGPWLILAYSIPGADGRQQATALARELRTTLKIPAFVMEKTVGVNDVLARRERVRTDRNGNLVPVDLEVRYANGGRESVYVVLVGEFASIDDPRVADVLEEIRAAHPTCLTSQDQGVRTASATESSSGLLQKYRSLLWKRTDRKDDMGPMGAAFVTRNPLLPDDYFEAPKVDDFVVQLNEKVENSLLKCPGKFTVRVASFTGRQVTALEKKSSTKREDQPTDALEEAAWQAHQLTKALIREGEDAYEFHDRYGSYVMIGSFDTLGQELASGQFQYHPGIVAILNKWCGYCIVETPRDPKTGKPARFTSLKNLDNIPFDVEGKPMAVPRASTTKLYGGSLLGGRRP